MATRNPNVLLSEHIAVQARQSGLPWDTYDADFLIAVVSNWLDQHNAVLTPLGVEPR